MIERKTTMAPEPFLLEVPVLEPVAVEGCDICEALAKQREEWRKVANFSKVSDCNVELAQHPHMKRPRR